MLRLALLRAVVLLPGCLGGIVLQIVEQLLDEGFFGLRFDGLGILSGTATFGLRLGFRSRLLGSCRLGRFGFGGLCLRLISLLLVGFLLIALGPVCLGTVRLCLLRLRRIRLRRFCLRDLRYRGRNLLGTAAFGLRLLGQRILGGGIGLRIQDRKCQIFVIKLFNVGKSIFGGNRLQFFSALRTQFEKSIRHIK